MGVVVVVVDVDEDMEDEGSRDVERVVGVVVGREVVEGSSVVDVNCVESSVVVVSESDEEVVRDRTDDVDESAVVVTAVAEAVSEGVEVDLAVLVVFELAFVVDVWTGTTSSAELVAVDVDVSGSRRLLIPLSIGSRRNDMLRVDAEMVFAISGLRLSPMANESLYNPVLAV